MKKSIIITLLTVLPLFAMEDSHQIIRKNSEQEILAETAWADMPTEVKMLILSFLTEQIPTESIKQLKRLALVNHEFQDLVNTPEFMQSNIARLVTSAPKKLVDELFINACKSGDLVSAQYFKDSGVDLDVTDKSQATALYWAVQHGHKRLTQYLVNAEAELHTAYPLLLLACSDKHEKVIEMLLQKNSFLDSYETALPSILQPNEENLRDLEYMLALAGPHLIDTEGATQLMYAAACGNIDLVSLLIRGKMRINIKDNCGCTALIAALVGRHFEVAELLISHGADINAKYMNSGSLLVFAVENAHSDIARFLLAHGADVNIKAAGSNETILMVAARKGFTQLAYLLITHGADINAKTSWNRTALEYAAACGDAELVHMLITHGADVNVSNNEGITPLMFAAKNGHHKIVKLLLAADIDKREKKNSKWLSFLDRFISTPDEVNKKDRLGNSAIIYAAKSGHADVVKLLLEQHAQVNVQGDGGMTALMWAASEGQREIVQMLIAAGANKTLNSLFHGKAIDYAREKGNQDIIKLLQD